MGHELADQAFANLNHYLFATWLSAGVVFYIAVIYYFLGGGVVSIFLVNFCLSLIVDLLIIGFLWGKVRRSILYVIPFLFYTIYYSIIPGKEVLTSVLFYSSIFTSFAILNNNRNAKKLIAAKIMCLVLAALWRANVSAIILLVDFYVYTSLRKTKLFRTLFIGFLLLTVVGYLAYWSIGIDALTRMADVQAYFEIQKERILDKSADLTSEIATTLLPENKFFLMVLAPVRVVAWFVAPFPMVDLSQFKCLLESCNPYNIFRGFESIARLISGIMNALFISVCVISAMQKYPQKKSLAWRYIFGVVAIPAALISTLYLVEGSRYRVLIEPALFLMFALSIGDRKRHI